MPYVDIAGASVSYCVDGHGPGLVLVAGTGGNLHSNWDHLVEHFSAHRTVVRVDYAGAGDTRDDEAVLSVERLAEQVLAAAKAAGLASFDLLGYSLGACIATQLAAENPHCVRSLCLLAGLATADIRISLQAKLWLQLIEWNPQAFARLVLLSGLSAEFLSTFTEELLDEWVDMICTQNRWEGITRQIHLHSGLDVAQQARAIAAPTLVIGCAHDQIVPLAHAHALRALIPGAQYAQLDCGHLAPFERPADLVSLVLEFITSQP